MPKHRHVWSTPNVSGFRHCLEPGCGHTQTRAAGSTLHVDSAARGVPQDRLPPKNPPPPQQSIPPLKVTAPGGVVFDPEQFKIASARMQSGMMSVSEAAERLTKSMRSVQFAPGGPIHIMQAGPLSQSIQAAPGGQVPPPPFDVPGFGNHEIEASPSEALDIIVRYLQYVAKEQPESLRQVASKWMTRMTDAVTGVLKEAEEGESE